jgi:hypothetical protein
LNIRRFCSDCRNHCLDRWTLVGSIELRVNVRSIPTFSASTAWLSWSARSNVRE